MKQGRGEKYIPFSLTSSNSSWHKGWFYLNNYPERALSEFIRASIAQESRSWSDRPPKAEQEKMLKEHWAALARLHHARVDLATVIGQYYARGVVPLRRRPLRLFEMTAKRAPFTGTVTAPEPPSQEEIQHHVSVAIEKASYSWLPSRLLPMVPTRVPISS
jgi:hypothetical protein